MEVTVELPGVSLEIAVWPPASLRGSRLAFGVSVIDRGFPGYVAAGGGS